MLLSQPLLLSHFNSHAHVERDEFDNDNNASYLNFNSHAHVERDSGQSFLSEMRKHFNSHAHVERDKRTGRLRTVCHNFNSHAHVERDAELEKNISDIEISTHTLTWSVTTWNFSARLKRYYFNSHAHVERDYYNYLYM